MANNKAKKKDKEAVKAGEERFVATGKSVMLLKPGKGVRNASGKKGK